MKRPLSSLGQRPLLAKVPWISKLTLVATTSSEQCGTCVRSFIEASDLLLFLYDAQREGAGSAGGIVDRSRVGTRNIRDIRALGLYKRPASDTCAFWLLKFLSMRGRN